MSKHQGLFFAINFAFLFHAALCLRLKEVHIPSHTVVNSTVRFECHYDLDGQKLYSVKWYKELNEFYRYVPRDYPAATVFSLPGIHVNKANSSDTFLVLENVGLETSGRYRCEVSAEAPSFQTVSEHGDMVVVVLPEDGPHITGGRPVYQIDDQVNVNCTSGRSKPATDLMWFINGKEAPPAYLRYYEKQRSNDFDGLETTTLGLKFPVTVDSFNKGNMKLKCLATIATVYWKSDERNLEGEKDKTGRPPRFGDSVRADRVQAQNSSASFAENGLIIVSMAFVNLLIFS